MGGAVIGGMLAISSTAVAMKMMEDAGEKDSNAGRLALAILVAQDLAVVPLLLITNALGAPSSPLGLALIGAKLVLALALLAGFIAILGRIKSFRFPGFRISAQGFRHRHPGRAGHLFRRRRRVRGFWACRRRWAPFSAGWRSAIPRFGAAR